MSVAVISHPDCIKHNMGDAHPESPARLRAIQDQLIASGLEFALRHFDALPANRNHLALVHSKRYLQSIFEHAPTQGEYRLDEDTLMTRATLPAAQLAAGAGIQAVDLVMAGKFDSVFCAVRPPGHHAEVSKAMGFCFFNNIAIAAAYAIDRYGLKKVAILDFDVHHGNGTEDFVKKRKDILFCSTFQSPFFPFSGTAKTPDHIINTPLAAGARSAEFRDAVRHDWMPALDKFAPEMIFISAGFDAHIEDDMAQLGLNDNDYYWVTQQIKDVADIECQGRIVSMLEGGYAMDALGRSVAAHINALLGNGN